MSQQGGRSLRGLLTVGLTALLLLVPALYNGAPWLFSDSVGYFRAGEATLSSLSEMLPTATATTAGGEKLTIVERAKDGIATARSPYYGTIFVLFNNVFGDWGFIVLQSVVVAAAFYFASPWLFSAQRSAAVPLGPLVLATGLSMLAGLGTFAGLVMPDVFTALLLLALAILLGTRAPGPRVGWLLLLLAALLFHKGHLAIAVLMLAFALLLRLWRRQKLASLAPVLLVVALGWLGHFAVGVVVERISRQPLHNPPFVLARVVADGTASLYLAEVCPESGLKLCKYHDRLPMPADMFLWHPNPSVGLYRSLPLEEQRTIAAETNIILRGILINHPGAQIEASFRNVLAQLTTLGVNEFHHPPMLLSRIATAPPMGGLLDSWPDTRIATGTMDLEAISQAIRISYAIAMLAVLAAGLRLLILPRPTQAALLCDHRLAIVAWLLFGILVNAVVSGVVSGVFERYQGRVAWLIPVIAVCLWSALRGQNARFHA